MQPAGLPAPSLPRNTFLNNGRYRIEREINRGGTAVVYAAEDTTASSYVALKVMHGPDQVPLKVVRREIAFSSSVSHDNIVRLLDVFAEGQQLVIVWELISGPDLLDLLNECGGCMPEDMAAFYFTQALRGLVWMHANGFCHRDIKPENCMVQRASHQLKLIDFGLSKHLASARTLGVGTPDYMSPEMLVHQQQNIQLPFVAPGAAVQPQYDARAVDAWAMGVLMYLLVTGRYPFENEHHPNNLAATVANVLAGRARPLPPHISPGCGALIAGLLRPRPEQRSTMLDLVCNPWLAEAAAQYARRVAPNAVQPQQPPSGGTAGVAGATGGGAAGPVAGPLAWLDLSEYRQLASRAATGLAGDSQYRQGQQQSYGNGTAGGMAAVRHLASAGPMAGPPPGFGGPGTAGAQTAGGVRAGAGAGVGVGVGPNGTRAGAGLGPAGNSEDMAAAAAAGAIRQGIAGVHPTINQQQQQQVVGGAGGGMPVVGDGGAVARAEGSGGSMDSGGDGANSYNGQNGGGQLGRQQQGAFAKMRAYLRRKLEV